MGAATATGVTLDSLLAEYRHRNPGSHELFAKSARTTSAMARSVSRPP